MMNELIFTAQALFVTGAALGALALGREALVAFICLQCVLANLFVLKQVPLFGLHATCADAFTIGATLGLNMLQEYFGREITRKTVWINFFLLLFYALVSQIHLAYAPPSVNLTHDAYHTLLTSMPRIVAASFTVYLIAQYIDYLLYGYLRHIFQNRFLVLRNYGSIIVSQFVDTVLFSFLGLYGLVENVWHIIAVSYGVKLLAIAIATPLVHYSRILHKTIGKK